MYFRLPEEFDYAGSLFSEICSGLQLWKQRADYYEGLPRGLYRLRYLYEELSVGRN